MANTWQGQVAAWLPETFHAQVHDDLSYELNRSANSLTFSVKRPDGKSLNSPIEVCMGGRRQGLGFLIPIRRVEGMPLARPTLVQARYAWSPEKNQLLLAPGCPPTRPESVESALGLVLSPTFEARCLSCHGQPNVDGSGGAGGVHCEACHGAGSAHLIAVSKGHPQQGIVNPKRLSNEASIDICARCHVGLTKFSDPSPNDLLVANQVRAIKSSECFIQSGKAFSCTSCHDPHNDKAGEGERAVKTCLGCHSTGPAIHAAICPVNATQGCVGCHMPPADMGPLHLVDHLIRVHPEQIRQDAKTGPDLKTKVKSVSAYLRIIETNAGESAALARRRLMDGESFYTVARELSIDRSAVIGGYLGQKPIFELEAGLQDDASQLAYGEVSRVIKSGGHWIILQRLPRDFKWQAEQLQVQAESLAARGDALHAIEKAQAALMIYPQFLRSLIFIGTTFAQNGNPKKGAEVLATATRLYSGDAGAEFALAATLNLLGDVSGARDAYHRVISLEPDFTAAYINLGNLLCVTNQLPAALTTFQQGLQIDPMSAELYYGLGLALTQSGDEAGGNQAINLARSLDSALIRRKEAGF